MKQISIQELAKYADKYILLSEDRTKIFASGKTIDQLEKKLEKAKITGGILHYVRPLDKALSLICHK